MDAITLLRDDHRQVLEMLDRLESAPTVAGGASEEALRARKSLVTRLVIAESRHEAIEEQYFWPMVRESVPGGAELAARAEDQEYAAKQVLDALGKAEPGQSDFDEMAARIVRDGRRHIAFEQDEVWPKVVAAVDSSRLEELGEKMAAAKDRAPTRPHPETPSSARVQKTLGRMAAVADRLRDTITGRGKR
ncbi:hemerythrin domain-containing protein [Amycolatopsis cynarae]|uniref:Hemerythrin domain-containing protein n=1 Tax=Amycolatopsis cynarae TaxID=2995223 RepID=A0ABY7BAM5_9PSEU|nr:hemerythrin domain-containing protein [Amycolatopsis sp. HUAS 11-8]WAL69422.1 hemerythrin domain-containing protein [Amycolatopsis sp. HUAS 11-8]